MKLLKTDESVTLYRGDCIEVMQRLIDDGVFVDSIVTDPPYNLLISCS